MDFLKDVFGSGMNIFGASAPQNTQRMIDAGLLAPDAGEKAQTQSLMRGLLGTAVSYASQPRTGGYNSWVPYAGKAFAQGMEQAQQPMDNMYDRAKQNHAMNQIAEEKMAKDNKAKFDKGLYQPNSVVNGLAPPPINPNLYEEDQNNRFTKVAPNFNPITQTQTPTWDSAKYLKDSLDNGLIDSEEYFKYKQLLNPTTAPVSVAAGGALVDPNTGEEIYKNPKNQLEKASNDFKVWNEMGGAANPRFPTFTKYNEWLKENGGVNITNQMPDNNKQEDRIATSRTDNYIGLTQLSNDAMADQNAVDRAMTLINNMGETGMGSESKASFDKTMLALGLDTSFYSKEQLNQRDVFESITNRLALGMRKAGTGVMTDKDFAVFKSMVGGLENYTEANKAILGFRQLMNDRRAEIGEKARAYRRGTVSFLKDSNGNPIAKPAHSLDDGFDEFLFNEQKETSRLVREMANRANGTDSSGNFSPDAFEVER